MERTYWVFNCNPKIWGVDSFFEKGYDECTWKVTTSQKDKCKIGDKGILRVGHDNRSRELLDSRQSLQRGIYATFTVLSAPTFMSDEGDAFWLDQSLSHEKAWRVLLKFNKIALNNPLLLESIPLVGSDPDFNKVVTGIATGTSTIHADTYNTISEHLHNLEKQLHEIENHTRSTHDQLIELEKRYRDRSPRVREALSKSIERGSIAQKFKKFYNYKCMICETLGLEAKGFKMQSGGHYIETHHVYPVSNLEKGSLGIHNLMTLCANHHREIHFGNIQVRENTPEHFQITYNDHNLTIKKKKLK